VPRGSASTPHGTRYGAGGAAEQEPAHWWAGVCRNTRALIEQTPDLPARLAAIGVGGQMLACLPVGADGEPLRPSMIHSDARAGREAALIDRDAVYRTSGNVADARSPLCKMLYLRAHEPDVYRRAARFLQAKDWIVGRMTGSFDSTDLSDAAHAGWLDVRRLVPATDLLEALGLDPRKLPQVHRSTEVVGRLSAEAARQIGLRDGVPVVAGAGDGCCATAGAGVVRPGGTYCCLGTTAWVALAAEGPLIDPQARVFNLPSLDGEGCDVYGTVQSAGRSVDWVMALLGEQGAGRLDALIASAPPGSGGLVFLPYLEGERTPIWDANARGVFFGIGPAHGRAHFVRAVVEGVSFALRSALDVLRESAPVGAMRLIGGGARSPAWQQMLADVWGLPVQVLSSAAQDATSLGAAIAAGVGVGIFSSVADGCRAVAVECARRPDPALRATYNAAFELYLSLYPALKDVFARRAEHGC
jgi:xylulokinase